MLCKKLISTLIFFISFQTTLCDYTLSGPSDNSHDLGHKMKATVRPAKEFEVKSVGQIIAENVSVRVTPADSRDSWNNQSESIGWEGFKMFCSDIGKCCKAVGKGTVFAVKSIGEGVLSIPEKIFDCVDWIGDKMDARFDPEDPLEIRLKQEQAEQQATVSAQSNNTTKNISELTKNTQNNNITQPNNRCSVSHNTILAAEEEIKIQQYDAMQEFIREHQPALKVYPDELSNYLSEIDNTEYRDVYDRGAKRLETCCMNKSNQEFKEINYTISHEVTPFMERHSLDIHSFEVCHGNAIQQHLHVEILEILTASSEIERIFNAYNESPLFSDLVAEGADLARELNTQGDIVQGFRIADYCGWLNEAEYPRLASIVKQAAGFVVGTVEGGINIVKNTYHMVRHPIDTGTGLVYVLGHASMFLFHGAQEVGPFAFHLSFHCTPSGYQIHPHFAQDIKGIKDFFNQTAQELAQLPPEERTRKVMAFFTELYFTGRFMGQVANIKRAATANIIKPGAISLANKLQLYKYKAITQTYTRIASTISNAQDIVKTTCKNWCKPPAYNYELVLDEAGNWKWVYDMNPTSVESIATECTSLAPLEKTPSILNRTSMTEIIQSTIQESASELLPGVVEKCVPTMIEYTAERPMLMTLDRKRPGFGEMKNRCLKINMDHLFEAKINGNHFDGLHHDYLGHYESNNILQIENKIEGKFGEYGGKPFWNGVGGYDKTFFPKHWTRKEVIEKIYEAYDDFLKNGANAIQQQDGKYQITGQTKDGMKIRMIISQKCHLKSAYPIM